MDQFRTHVVEDGKLASYTFIEPAHNTVRSGTSPRLTNSQHPHNNVNGQADFLAGERLIRDVYETSEPNPSCSRGPSC